MCQINLENNEFLRQFEAKFNNSLARIEYAEQERKIFLTKIIKNLQMYCRNYFQPFCFSDFLRVIQPKPNLKEIQDV